MGFNVGRRKWLGVGITTVLVSSLVNASNIYINLYPLQPEQQQSLLVTAAISIGASAFVLILSEIRNHSQVKKEVSEAIRITKIENETERKRYYKIFLTELLRGARKYIAPDGARASIFLLDKHNDELYMYHHSGPFDERETQLRFGIQIGVVGYVFWHYGQPICIDLEGYSVADLRQEWRLNLEQIKLTSHLKSILAVPILLPNDNNQLIGILAIDSKEPAALSGLNEQLVADKAVNLAEQLVKYIEKDSYRAKTRPTFKL